MNKTDACKKCPVKPCATMNYRGSTCAAQRAKFGLGDPMTNADRIRAMSDEQLAKHFSNLMLNVSEGVEYHTASGIWLEWLKQPAEV